MLKLLLSLCLVLPLAVLILHFMAENQQPVILNTLFGQTHEMPLARLLVMTCVFSGLLGVLLATVPALPRRYQLKRSQQIIAQMKQQLESQPQGQHRTDSYTMVMPPASSVAKPVSSASKPDHTASSAPALREV